MRVVERFVPAVFVGIAQKRIVGIPAATLRFTSAPTEVSEKIFALLPPCREKTSPVKIFSYSGVEALSAVNSFFVAAV